MDLQELIETLKEYGPPGLFLAAFISNAIPGFPAIYLTIVGTYAVLVDDPATQLAVVLAAGVGAGLGKIFVFYVSNAVASRSKRVQKLREEYMWVLNRGKLSVFILVLLFASLPLPDDVLYIPLGVSGFSLFWFSLGVIIGKIILTLLVMVLGRSYRSLMEKLMGTQEQDLGLVMAGMIIGTLIITYIMFAMNWVRIYKAYTEKGALRAMIVFLEELFQALTLRPIRQRLARRDTQPAGPAPAGR